MTKFGGDLKMVSAIALSYMRSKLRQTVVATIGVVLGITIFVFLLGYVKGINGFMRELSLQETPHIRLYNEIHLSNQNLIDKKQKDSYNIVYHSKPHNVSPNLKNAKHLIRDIKKDIRIKTVSGTLESQVFYHIGTTSVNGSIVGIEYENENSMFNLDSKLIEGSFKELSIIQNSLVMGSGLAKRLNLKIGDKVNITTDKGELFTTSIIGLFKTGILEFDNNNSYCNLKTFQHFLDVSSTYITTIKIQLYDMNIAPIITSEFQNKYSCQISNWQKDNAALLESEFMENLLVYGVALSILFVAGFGIYNILNMMIYEKMKDIAIFKAMGFSNSDVRMIFLFQSLLIGIIGSIFGLIFGFILSYMTSKVSYNSEFIVSMKHIPISFDSMFYITGLCFGLIVTSLAGYFPSRKAAKTDPISILKNY
jgi:lipoprotein-releasing system permease protein